MTQSFSFFIYKPFFILVLVASFFVAASMAQAVTIAGPGATIVGRESEYVAGSIDASMYSDLHLSFDYVAEKLDTGDSFTYGWRGDTEEVLGTFAGLPDGATAVPGDESGTISVDLPDTAVVSNLEIFVRVTANSTIDNDSVEISNLVLTGVPIVVDVDGDGVSNAIDNCSHVANTNQADFDMDGMGDACDNDDDGDGIADEDENVDCDLNSDTLCGVVINLDEDNDGVIEGDYCPGTVADVAGGVKLNPNHWRYNGTWWVKGLTRGGQGNSSVYTMNDTRGCSCDQVINILQSHTGENYLGHRKSGCSAGFIEDFLEFVW